MEVRERRTCVEALFLAPQPVGDDEGGFVHGHAPRKLGQLGVRLLWLLAVVTALAVFVRSLSHRKMPAAFRASVTVPDAMIGDDQLVSRLTSYLVARPEVCGVSAAALRVYQRVAVVRDGNGLLVLFNPRFDAFASAPWAQVTQRSWLCRPAVTYSVQMAERGTVTHRVKGSFVGTVVRGAVAHCVQHLVSELAGAWWCPDDHPRWSRALEH